MNYTPYVFKTALINYKNTLFSNEQAEKLFPMEVMKISKAKKSSSLSFNINDANQVHNINLVNDYSYDKNDKKLYGDCKLSYNSLVNLELEYLQKDNKTSFTLKNIFDNYYYIYNDILELKDFSKLGKMIEKSKSFKPKKFVSNTQNLIEHLEDYIDNL